MTDTLHTALTKLLDEYAADGPSGVVRDLGALLAAHPAPTEPADLRLSENGWLYGQKQKCDCSPHYGCHEISCAKEPWVNLTDLPGWDEMLAAHPAPVSPSGLTGADGRGKEWLIAPPPAPVSDTRREDVARRAKYQAMRDHEPRHMGCACGAKFGDSIDARWHLANQVTAAVLAALPAPPVVDGGWTVVDWEEWANEVAATLPEDCDGDEAQTEIIAAFVRRAAAPPVVDETEIEREALRQFPDVYYVPDRDQVRLGFEAGAEWAIARLRGATRG